MIFLRKKQLLVPADEFFFRFPENLRLQFQPSDVFLISFPRSGNTWMRHLIAGCFQKPLDNLIPDLHHPSLDMVPRCPLPGGIFLFKSHTICDLEDYRKIYLFRNPADSLVSYAHFAGRADKGCDKFVLRSIKTWVHQVAAVYSAYNKEPSRCYLISYERLLNETKSTLLSAFQYLGMDGSGLAIDEAIRDSTKVPHLNKGAGNYVSAAPGKGKSQLLESTLLQIEELALPIYSKLRDLENQQNLLKTP